MKYLWKFLNKFCQDHFLWDVFILFVAPLSSCMSVSSPILNYLGETLLNGTVPTSPWSAISSVTPLMPDSYCTSSITILHFVCCTLIFLGQFLLSIIHLKQLQSLLSVGKWNNRCTVTNHWQTLKEVMRLVPDHDVHVLLSSDWYFTQLLRVDIVIIDI